MFQNGPSASETATPNPFTNYRLDVTFRGSSNTIVMTVPGYFAADGDAANTSASSGTVWHCHFAPPAIGTWTWEAAFRSGSDIAFILSLKSIKCGEV